MTNYEMYKEEILKRKNTKYNKCLNSMGYAVASLCGTYDLVEMLEWLFEEYEPTLLKNGDGLKPGDWIMVRDVDSQSFVRRQFLYFFDGKFVCSAPNNTPLEGFGEPWKQARLPIEGE